MSDKMASVEIQYLRGFADPISSVYYWVIQIKGDATFYKVNAQSVRAKVGGGKYTTERRRLKPLTAAERGVIPRDKHRITNDSSAKEASEAPKTLYQQALAYFSG